MGRFQLLVLPLSCLLLALLFYEYKDSPAAAAAIAKVVAPDAQKRVLQEASDRLAFQKQQRHKNHEHSPAKTLARLEMKLDKLDAGGTIAPAELPEGAIVLKSKTRAPFLITVLDPEVDNMLSAFIFRTRLWDVHVLMALEHAIGNDCATAAAAGAAARTADVGANLGFFSMSMLAMGCDVTSFEMQPEMANLVRLSARFSGASARHRVIEGAVSDVADTVLQRGIGTSGNIGGVGIVHRNAENAPNQLAANRKTADVQTLTLDNVFEGLDASKPLLAMKMDIEGHENNAIKGFAKVLSAGGVRNIVMEFSPVEMGLAQAIAMLELLQSVGFSTIFELDYIQPSVYLQYAPAETPFETYAHRIDTRCGARARASCAMMS